jgi:hypothetical protein
MFEFMVLLLFVFWADAVSMNKLPNPNTAISANAKDTFLILFLLESIE